MKTNQKLMMTAVAVAALALVGCGGGFFGDDDDEGVITDVPDSAGVGTAAYVGFIQALLTGDETSEPLTIRDSFNVPAEEAAEPTPLT